MVKTLQYVMPVVFIILGLVIRYSKDPAWNSSKKMSTILVVLGIITLLGRLALDYNLIK